MRVEDLLKGVPPKNTAISNLCNCGQYEIPEGWPKMTAVNPATDSYWWHDRIRPCGPYWEFVKKYKIEGYV